MARANDAGGRAGFQHADAFAPRLVGIVEAAVRLHDQELAGERGVFEKRIRLVEIALHARTDIGIGRDRRGALELAVFLRQLVRGGDEDLRQAAHEEIARTDLVVRIAVGMQEQDRDRLDAFALQPLRDHLKLVVFQRAQHIARGVHALVDLDAQRALDQRPVLAEEQIVGFRAG